MITLTRITEPDKLEEYYRFRYRIYSESRLKGVITGEEGQYKDAFDDRAYHYGWYVDGCWWAVCASSRRMTTRRRSRC
ncbi:MAG: hypothetical protein HUU33_07220 [Flavobacteriales bacterium]|nr:hypothetical protein [Flavobacteriales bacterium]